MSKCEKCGKEVVLPFTCNYCGNGYCDEHRLPENHDCQNQPARTPLGSTYNIRTPRTMQSTWELLELRRLLVPKYFFFFVSFVAATIFQLILFRPYERAR